MCGFAARHRAFWWRSVRLRRAATTCGSAGITVGTVTPISGKVEDGKNLRLDITNGWRIATSAAMAVMSWWKATGSRSFRRYFAFEIARVNALHLDHRDKPAGCHLACPDRRSDHRR